MINTPFQCVLLKDVVYFQEGPGLRNWQYGNTGIPFLNIRTINDNGFIDKDLCQFVKPEEFYGKYEHFLLNAGDYVVSSSGTLGKLAEIREEDLPLMLNTSVIRGCLKRKIKQEQERVVSDESSPHRLPTLTLRVITRNLCSISDIHSAIQTSAPPPNVLLLPQTLA